MVYSSSLSSVWSCEVPAWQLCFKSSYRIATTNKMQYFLDLFISINCCTCFRRFLRPSSGAQNYIQHQLLSNQYCCLLLGQQAAIRDTCDVRTYERQTVRADLRSLKTRCSDCSLWLRQTAFFVRLDMRAAETWRIQKCLFRDTCSCGRKSFHPNMTIDLDR